jgi:hypothetical protein
VRVCQSWFSRQFARRKIFSLKSIIARHCGEEILHEQERNSLEKKGVATVRLSLSLNAVLPAIRSGISGEERSGQVEETESAVYDTRTDGRTHHV